MPNKRNLALLTFLLFIVSLYCYEINLTGDVLRINGEPGELTQSTLSVGLGRFTTLEMKDLNQGAQVGDPDLPHYTKCVPCRRMVTGR